MNLRRWKRNAIEDLTHLRNSSIGNVKSGTNVDESLHLLAALDFYSGQDNLPSARLHLRLMQQDLRDCSNHRFAALLSLWSCPIDQL